MFRVSMRIYVNTGLVIIHGPQQGQYYFMNTVIGIVQYNVFFSDYVKKQKKTLTEEELLYYLENDAESDIPDMSDEEDCAGDDDDHQTISADEIFEILTSQVEGGENEDNSDNDVPNNLQEKPDGELLKNIQDFRVKHRLTDKGKINWMEDVTFETRKVKWYKPPVADELTVEMPPPIDFFMRYVPEELFQQMSDMTNLYATQKNVARFPATSVQEIKKFIGVHITIGNLQFPRARMYWSSKYGISLIKEALAINRFFKLRQTLHLVDITARPEGNQDRLWKVRHLYDSIRKRCQELSLETNLCVDEQMVPFKGRINIKQYMKNKPTKWGIKIFVLAGQSGIIYDFLIYQGSTTELNPVYGSFGQGAGIIMQLSERITEENHGLYFDNYFSSYNLFEFLMSKSIFAIGTIRVNRFFHPKLPSDKNLKKKGRGSSSIALSRDGIVLTKWYDNKAVITGSNFVGIGQEDQCTRWDKAKKTHIQVSRPESIRLYNQNMGGVDKIDFLLSIYRSYIRTRKWTVRMICHAIDMALVNSWLEYKQQAENLGVQKKKILDLLGFRESVAEHLILFKSAPKRGRPSASDQNDEVPLKRTRYESMPYTEMRYDGHDHMPLVDEKKENTRCKLEMCKYKSHIYCSKCNVHLCIMKGRNCFANFHSR